MAENAILVLHRPLLQYRCEMKEDVGSIILTNHSGSITLRFICDGLNKTHMGFYVTFSEQNVTILSLLSTFLFDKLSFSFLCYSIGFICVYPKTKPTKN